MADGRTFYSIPDSLGRSEELLWPPFTVDIARAVRDELNAIFLWEISHGVSIMERLRTETEREGPTTVCLDCDAIIHVADSYHKRTDETFTLCEPCFKKAETAGRAKE